MKPGALLLFPGAGSDRDHSSLRALEDALAPRLPVARADFPYRRAGRKAPDRPPVLLECVRTEAAALVARAHIRADRLVLGGRSMGGRICSMAVADGLPARGLVLISYPLHPPGRPDRLRIEHLTLLDLPCLIIQGTKDPFGTPDELTEATASIPGPVTHVWIDGGRHDLARADEQIVAAVTSWLRGLT
ncbi:MAG: alpha/beta family hydrolase [Acidimicrobiia bacterium]